MGIKYSLAQLSNLLQKGGQLTRQRKIEDNKLEKFKAPVLEKFSITTQKLSERNGGW